MVKKWELAMFIMLKAEAACCISKLTASVKTLLCMSL